MTKKKKRKNGSQANSLEADFNPASKMLKRSPKDYDLSEEDRGELHTLFNKKRKYSKDEILGLNPPNLIQNVESNLLLLESENLTADLAWCDENLMALKKEMNDLKDQLSTKDIETWHNHTTECNIAGKIIPYVKSLDVELCTQAWVKFYEILNTYTIVPNQSFLSVHLCEAPGAFIAALNNFLRRKAFSHFWNWCATTLHPYQESNSLSEMVADDRLIRMTYHKWFFGPDGTGDLKANGQTEGLRQFVRQMEKKYKAKVLLLTADGSKDCQENPAEQEALLSQLHYCEMLTGCLILAPTGTLVLKVFTMLEACTIALMCLLNIMFDEVNCFKPATSKSGNSETYLVCTGYRANIGEETLNRMLSIVKERGIMCFLNQKEIPQEFLQEHRLFCNQFAQWQSNTILGNMRMFEQKSTNNLQVLNQLQESAVDVYVEKTNVSYSRHTKRIVPFSREKSSFYNKKLDHEFPTVSSAKTHFLQWQHKNLKGTFHLRQNINSLSFMARINLMEVRQIKPQNTGLTCRYPLEDKEVEGWSEQDHQASLPKVVLNSRLCEGPIVDDFNFLIQNADISRCCKDQKLRHIEAMAELLIQVVTRLVVPERVQEQTSALDYMQHPPETVHKSQQQDVPWEESQLLHHHHKNKQPQLHPESSNTEERGVCIKPSQNETVTVDKNEKSPAQLCQSANKSPVETESLPHQTSETKSSCSSVQLLWIKHTTESDNNRLLLENFLEKQEIRGNASRIKVINQCLEQYSRENFCRESNLVVFQNLSLLFLGVDDDFVMYEESQSRHICLQKIIQLLKHLPLGCHLVLLTSTFLTRFHSSLLYLLARHFNSIHMASETNLWLHQLVVCEGFQGTISPSLMAFLMGAQRQVEQEEDNTEGNNTIGLVELVPFIQVLNDRKFVQFVTASNNYLLSGFTNLILEHYKYKTDGQ